MVILITGSTHTGKTMLAQKLLEQYQYPYLSLDHLKMGLIRSGQTKLTPEDDDLLTPYLWGIAKEIVKTAIENHQNLIIEGCYIPFNWRADFTEEYLSEIRYLCLVMSEAYIRNHFDAICNFANVIEARGEDYLNIEEFIQENICRLAMCKQNGLPYFYIEDTYDLPEKVTELFAEGVK